MHLNVWILVHISARSRKLPKAENDVFTSVLRLRKYVHLLFSTNTAGRKEAIVSTCSPLPNRFTIKV